MLEDKLRVLFRKGSLTSRARRTLLVLLIFLVALIGYRISFASEASWADGNSPLLGSHADLHDEQARIGKISILYGGTKLHYERALQSHKRHNRQHGYPMFVQRVDVLDGYWTKPAFIHYMILRELRKPESQRLQWLFWFDADTIILNYNVPLEIFLPPEDHEGLRNINILISDDWNGLNNGIFGIRVSRYAAELFAGILAFRDFEPETELVFQDQSAMEILLKRRKSINHVAKVPQRWFNAYATDDERPGSSFVHPGDFLVHFAGTGARDIRMNKWADKSEQLNYKWNTPLTHLKLPEDIQRFWNRTKSVWDARQNHWVKGTKHLQASIFNVNITLNEWRTAPQNESNTFLSLAKAKETAEYFIGNSTKYNGEIIKEDLHQLGKIVLELENAHRVFSNDAIKIKASIEEERKKKEEERRKKEEEEKKEGERKKKEEEEKKKEEEEHNQGEKMMKEEEHEQRKEEEHEQMEEKEQRERRVSK
ncbi:hypothetical protein E4U33_006333 [Claviceps sp. LM78 group G4]|nr:hypothetical protein E4U33_006333 [Claviceps sp. LM78 group G4]